MINQHYIGKQVFDLKLFKQEDAFALQQKLGNAYWSVVKDRLDQLFSELSHPEELIQIDRLEIDLGNVAEHEVERVLADRIIEQLQEALANEILQARLFHQPEQQSQLGRFNTWLYFLEHGVLPWNSTNQMDGQAWFIQAIESIAGNALSLEKFRRRIIQRPAIVNRLIKQHSTDQLALIMEAISGEKRTTWLGLHRLLRQFTDQQAVQKLRESTNQKQLKNTLAALRMYSQQQWTHYFWTQAIHHYLVQRKRSRWEAFSAQLVLPQSNFPTKERVQLLLLVKRQLTWQAEEKQLLQDWIQYLPSSEVTRPQEGLGEGCVSPTNPAFETSEQTLDQKADIPSNSQVDNEESQSTENKMDQPPSSSQSSADGLADAASGLQIEEEEQRVLERKVEEKSSPHDTVDQPPPDPLIDAHKEETEGAPMHASTSLSEAGNKASPDQPPTAQETPEDKIAAEEREETIKPLVSQQRETRLDLSIEERWQNYLQAIKDGQALTENLALSRAKILEQQQLEKEGIYLSNAGLVLIHPFILPYFENVGLVKEGTFIDPQAQEKAVHLLAYLAIKEEGVPEYKLSLPKLLCGLPLSWPIEKAIALGEEEKLEGERLLEAAVKHWGALGDVSPDALREGFLQRDGKLVKKNEDWILTVEQKTMDVLLDKLPFGWGVSMIKLPWMNELLKVNWI
ncbi:MAG: contractile injection system tape measure protein [Bacteroidota bacterium]